MVVLPGDGEIKFLSRNKIKAILAHGSADRELNVKSKRFSAKWRRFQEEYSITLTIIQNPPPVRPVPRPWECENRRRFSGSDLWLRRPPLASIRNRRANIAFNDLKGRAIHSLALSHPRGPTSANNSEKPEVDPREIRNRKQRQYLRSRGLGPELAYIHFFRIIIQLTNFAAYLNVLMTPATSDQVRFANLTAPQWHKAYISALKCVWRSRKTTRNNHT